MFKVDRLPSPTWMASNEFDELRNRLTGFYESGGTRTLQERFPLEQELRPFEEQILAALHDQFGGLCAYSEVAWRPKDDVPPHRLLWHRPTGDAASLDGKVDYEHYWWLTLDWGNWYLGSSFTESVKSYLFPVIGARMPVAAHGDLDIGLLLDPCNDEPAWWLSFGTDGSVVPRRPPSAAESERLAMVDRGELTIRILDLDDDMLRASRHRALRELETSSFWKQPGPDIVDHVIDDALAHRGALLQGIITHRISGPWWNGEPIDVAVFERLVERVPEVLGAQLLANATDGMLDDVPSATRDRLEERLVAAFPDLPESEQFQEVFASAPARSRPRTESARTAKKPATGRVAAKKASRTRTEKRTSVSIGPTDRITRILIKNFRAIQEIELTIDSEFVPLPPKVDSTGKLEETTSPTAGTQWKSLLGENGSGKSSILHAVALALTGDRLDEFCAAAGLEWSGMLRRSPDDIQGRILLEFSGKQRIDLRFTDSKAWFHGLGGEAPAMHVNVRAYGATRLLRRSLVTLDESVSKADALCRSVDVLLDADAGRAERLAAASDAEALLADIKGAMTVHARNEGATVAIGNLLDPSVPVIDATAWLLDLAEPEFNVAALTLSDLLGKSSAIPDPRHPTTGSPGKAKPRLERRRTDPGGKIKVLVDGDPLDDVSDGYRSVIAVACDIMRGIGGLDADDGLSDLARARGIVLIDEVGAHLHPSWRMQITDRLRRTFPNVQFLVSTHEPLCLRGLQANEVVKVLKYERHGVIVQPIEMSPAQYRVDQLLTSDFFGLDSAIDPEVDGLYRRFYELRRKQLDGDPVSDELLALDRKLNSQRLRPKLGYTRRDQMMYEAIDLFLESEPTLDHPRDRQRERLATVEKVADQWRKMAGLRR
ncbi:AAA family ATPase [Ilumatobacter sp.]|uniref:AAA family ATPase n=1 Tax=Ilumatobacter sp. TaxID=1967498 RepID=UPI003C60597D